MSRMPFGLGIAKSGKMKEESAIPVYAKLLFEKDVRFYVDGKPATLGQILALAEESDYMADYVPGKEGKIAEVRFDRIHQT